MKLSETSFEDAKESFIAFLSENGFDLPLLWTFKEDVYSRNNDRYERDFWLKIPLPDSNEELAKRHFEFGKSKGFGVALTAYAICEEGLCCSFVLPDDDEDAQYMLMGPESLKMSFVSRDMPTAKVIRNQIGWKLFGLFPFLFRTGNHFVYLASKADFR